MTKLTQNELESYAQKILNDYDLKNPSVLFKNNINISVSDAYKIQSITTNFRLKRGEKIIGYKIGSISKQTQKKYGFSHPAWGRLWKSELHTNGVELNKKDYSNPAMEAEFGITLNRDLEPYQINSEYLLDSIDTIHPIIEIHNKVFYGKEPYGAEHISNNAINAGVVCGTGVSKPNINEITDLKLIYDKEKIDVWTAKKWPHDMLSEIEWFVLEQAKRNNILKKGNLILTGAYGPPIPINDKKLIEVTSSLFGNVSAVFK
jgi:2-keto-4-pentenoate hydratase